MSRGGHQRALRRLLLAAPEGHPPVPLLCHKRSPRPRGALSGHVPCVTCGSLCARPPGPWHRSPPGRHARAALTGWQCPCQAIAQCPPEHVQTPRTTNRHTHSAFVSGTGDPRSSQTGQVIRGLRGHDQHTFGPTEGQTEQWREANRRRQRQTNQHHGLVPNPSRDQAIAQCPPPPPPAMTCPRPGGSEHPPNCTAFGKVSGEASPAPALGERQGAARVSTVPLPPGPHFLKPPNTCVPPAASLSLDGSSPPTPLLSCEKRLCTSNRPPILGPFQ